MLDVEKIRHLYRSQDMKQKDFAAAIGITQSHLSQIEGNKKRATLWITENMAATLNVTVDEILVANPTQTHSTERSGVGAALGAR